MKPTPNDDARRDDAAVSILIGYIINIGVAAIVISVTLFLLQGVFADAQDNAVQSELEAVGQSFASELERVDVLSNRTDSDVSTTAKLPESDNPYTITVFYDGPDQGTRINVESGSASVDLGFSNETAIAGADDGISVGRGGTPEIIYDSTEDEILIR